MWVLATTLDAEAYQQPVAAYAAAKAFVLSYTEGLRSELRGTGVTATALCPGPVALPPRAFTRCSSRPTDRTVSLGPQLQQLVNAFVSDVSKLARQSALDVFAAWSIHQTLMSLDIGALVTKDTPGGTPVTLFSRDGSRRVADGFIFPDKVETWSSVKVTARRIVVTLASVRVPAHKLPASLSPTKAEIPLGQLQLPATADRVIA